MLPNDVLSIQLWSTRGTTPLAGQLAYLKECGYAEHDAPSDWRRFARVSAAAMRRFALVSSHDGP
jgi:hypothetical protein